MSALELFLIAALIVTSAYFAASELALFSLSRFQLRYFREHARGVHRKIKRLLSDPSGLLITILVANEVLNVAVSTLITRGVAESLPIESWEIRIFHIPGWVLHAILGTLIAAPVLLICCEVTPKTIAVRANQIIAPLTVNTISVVYDLFKPIRIVLERLVALVGQTESSKSQAERQETIKESDFLLMLEEGHKEGAVQSSEFELIKNVFEFDDTKVADVFTPLAQVRSLPMTSTIRDALAAMRMHRYSRIPVTGTSRTDVVGILYSKDLLQAKLENDLQKPISEMMLRPIFVAPSLKLNALFRLFKQRSTHMAIVQKPLGPKPPGQRAGGEALGIITMSDILDTLFDDLFPEEGAEFDGDFDEEAKP